MGALHKSELNPPLTPELVASYRMTITKIGIKYNLIHENRLKKITSKPEPVMKASLKFLKEIKTDPTLVKELLAIIAK